MPTAIKPKKKAMKLSRQFALTCGSFAIIMVGLTTLIVGLNTSDAFSVYYQMSAVDRLADISIYKPLKILYLGLPATIIGAFVGYVIGDILDNPRGSIPEHKLAAKKKKKEEEEAEAAKPVMTGDESFLDDMDSLFDDASDIPSSGFLSSID
jgi:ABC-type lipoprotein release transport system permease subunit